MELLWRALSMSRACSSFCGTWCMQWWPVILIKAHCKCKTHEATNTTHRTYRSITAGYLLEMFTNPYYFLFSGHLCGKLSQNYALTSLVLIYVLIPTTRSYSRSRDLTSDGFVPVPIWGRGLPIPRGTFQGIPRGLPRFKSACSHSVSWRSLAINWNAQFAWNRLRVRKWNESIYSRRLSFGEKHRWLKTRSQTCRCRRRSRQVTPQIQPLECLCAAIKKRFHED